MGNNNKIQDSCQSLQTVVSVSAGLSGKAKIDFEKWLNKQGVNTKIDVCNFEVNNFISLSSISQNALVIEWLDSVKIHVNTYPRFYEIITFNNDLSQIKTESPSYFDNRQETIINGIKKANEIYNAEAEH